MKKTLKFFMSLFGLSEATQEKILEGPKSGLSGIKYTVGTLYIDLSGSNAGREAELASLIDSVVVNCSTSGVAERILLRMVTFCTKLSGKVEFKELCTFTPVRDLVGKKYELVSFGGTPLYYACCNAAVKAKDFVNLLVSEGRVANALTIVFSDGEDTKETKHTEEDVKKAFSNLKNAVKSETSITVLISVGAKGRVYGKACGFEHVIDAGDVTPAVLGQVANFIQSSFVDVSQKTGTGEEADIDKLKTSSFLLDDEEWD